jgi:hypothetical protein
MISAARLTVFAKVGGAIVRAARREAEMGIEGLDAGLPMETAGFLPQVGISGGDATDAMPTLDAALRQAEQAANPALESISARAAMRAEMAAPDLWIGQGLMIRAAHDFNDARVADTSSADWSDGTLILRDLTAFEKKLVGGALGTTGVTVIGPPSWEDFYSFFFMLGNSGGGGGGTSGGTPPAQQNEFDDPDCDKGNALLDPSPPDNAKYFLPENIDKHYINNVLNHLSDFARTHYAWQLLAEFKSMYTNPNHPYFIDFKDWGTANGPPGSVSGGTTTYYSPAAGHDVTASVFEPFGNWFYGFAGTWAGISADVLYGAAALVQEGDTSFIPQDAAEDRPHVTAGIVAALSFAEEPRDIINIAIGNCATGTTSDKVGASALGPPVIHGEGAAGDAYRAGLWSYLEDAYYEVYP